MRFRAVAFCVLASAIALIQACARGPAESTPTTPGPESPLLVHTTATGSLQPGHNLLGLWQISVDPEAGTFIAIPVRMADLHLNVLRWLELGPCTDCLWISDFEILPSKELRVQISLRHPFVDPRLSGFDVRGICMFEGDEEFPNLGVVASTGLQGNPELINADGFTTLYNPTTDGHGFQGYSKGKMAPGFASPTATLNGYKVYFSDSNRRYFLAGDTLSADFIIRPPGGPFTFGYAVDASWEKPTQPVTVPDSFPITANSLEAYLIETELSTPLALTPGATSDLTIDVYDWQGESTLSTVHVEGPYFWDGLIEATPDTGGPGTRRFTCEIVNEFGFVGSGVYPVLVRVFDTASQPGSLIDNTAWQIVKVNVIQNKLPQCGAEVSDPEPDPGELVTFTDTSTDPDGLDDLDESWWDWNNDTVWDEEGFEMTHAWDDPGVYYVNHKIIDKAGAADTLTQPLAIDVGLFITLQEDLDAKPNGRAYRYISLTTGYSSGSIINVDDPDGPWDFTDIGLISLTNFMSVIDDDDPEVEDFVDDFNPATTHFVKFTDMLDPFFPILYQAEYHHFPTKKLYIYGFHDPLVIGSAIFGPPETPESLAIPFPLTTLTDYSFIVDKPGFYLTYEVKALGEGDVTVPYEGGGTYHCLLLRYRFTVSAPDPLNGGTLNFVFITDQGRVVANVIAVNDPPIYNWNQSTNKIFGTGTALFQALHAIED